MSTVSLQEALRIAIGHHQAGQLAQAEAIYRQILQAQPKHPDALHLLGVIALQVGQHGPAVELIGAALQAAPNNADFLGNYGEALRGLGRQEEALATYREALRLNPRHSSAYNNLGIVLKQLGRDAEAIAAYRQAITLKPDYFQALNNLAITLKEHNQADEAIRLYRQALTINPDSAETCNNLGVVLREQGQGEEAAALFRRALTLRPEFADAHEGLASCLRDQGRLGEAVAAYRQALSLNPQLANAWNNLGVALKESGQPLDAIAAYRQALEIQPEMADALNNLGIALKEQGTLTAAAAHLQRAITVKAGYAEAWNNLGQVLEIQGNVEEALSAYRQALKLNPAFSRVHSNILFALNYLPGLTAQEIFEEHRRWAQTYADPLTPPASPPTVVEKQRLSIGYVSPDFRQHPVAYFLEAVLAHHDATRFEIFCYSDVSAPDAVTARLRGLVPHWRDSHGLSDEALGQQIRHDAIDILIDLTGHTDRNRLFTFARRPAPRQASWIGYFNTTGMQAMDYFISDVYGSPTEIPQLYTETLVRLPHSRFCYHAPDYAPTVAPLPAAQNGYVTFGCFNNLAKLNDAVIALWAQILTALPSSRLVLKALALGEEVIQASYRERFAAHGIATERLIFSGFSPHAEMLVQYGDIDIALDPFPFTGGLTSCEALWMGVPVVTLAGETLVSRQSASLLNNLDLAELCAATPRQYAAIAVALANTPQRLAELRAGLRERMAASPLCDAAGFTRDLEQAYREMWGG